MAGRPVILGVSLIIAGWSAAAAAFRNCDLENDHAYLATTHYMVGEIEFDAVTGTASGTKTIYNFSNQREDGFEECHVTYELTGSYTAGSGTLVLDARRTNFSPGCPRELIAGDYPADRTYALQVDFDDGGSAAVHAADNGDLLAQGSWGAGRAVYKTAETCTVF